MIVVPTDRGVTVGCSAGLIGEPSDAGVSVKAWAERYIRTDPDLRWVLGNYVEADNANDNGHIFPAADLCTGQATLAGKPLNMMHREHYIVGCFAGAQLVSADGQPFTAAEVANDAIPPQLCVEALAGMWHSRFPEEFFQIKKAHSEGTLFFSMEAIPKSVSCPTCEHTSPYAGLASDQYCGHMNGATGPKRLHNPTFNGGAIIIPPVRPGWQRADIKEISKLMEDPLAEPVYAQVADETPHLGPQDWEAIMVRVLHVADGAHIAGRDFSNDKRDKMAKKGTAMPDGSYPIANASDLKNAIKAVGRAKNPGAAKSHIKRRARALGLEDLIPAGW